jgi:hypothetical protein
MSINQSIKYIYKVCTYPPMSQSAVQKRSQKKKQQAVLANGGPVVIT